MSFRSDRLAIHREMKQKMLIGAMFLSAAALSSQDRLAVVAANGIAFSEFRGYDTWQPPSRTDDGLKVIVENPVMKDAKRFPDTDGLGYAQFVYNAVSDTLTPEESDSSFGKKLCHQCPTLVKAKDFVFTAYPIR
jgi:hypothetical protein